jgi:hypothetical protein
MKAIAVLLGTLLVAACATSQPEYMPHPRAEITKEQWVSYHEQVISAHGSTRRTFPDEHLEVFNSNDERKHFAFTTEGHPAHPAWITRQVTEKDGKVFSNQIGYFAGHEEPFAKLFRAYQQLTERTVQQMQSEEPK